MSKGKHGGARPGAGRKPIDPGARRVSHTLTMAPDAWRQLDEIGEEQGVRARGRIVEQMLIELVDAQIRAALGATDE